MNLALRTALVAGVALAAGAAQAAITVSSINGPDTPQANVLFDFEGGNPGVSGNFAIVNGSLDQKYAAPLGDTTDYLVVPINGSSGVADLDLGGEYGRLSFYWGSIDTYNSVTFFDINGVSLGTVFGGDVPNAPANGAQGDALNNRRVFFNFQGDSAASVRFTSTDIAFELDDIATAVPEPAVWMTMLTGFALVGGAVRRRRSTFVTA